MVYSFDRDLDSGKISDINKLNTERAVIAKVKVYRGYGLLIDIFEKIEKGENEMELLLAILLVSAVFVVITYLLGRFTKARFVKYVPAAVCLAIALRYGYLAKFAPREGMRDLADFLGFMLFMPGAAAGIITALVLDKKSQKK